jgi:CRP/FNR family transcriptional regulator, cyclic AMP receptor protein
MIIDSLWDNIFRGRQKGGERTLDLLLKIPIFENLSFRELRVIEKMVYIRRYASGEAIFQQGDPSLGMYIVRTGSVRIIRQFPGGEPRLIATLTAGEFFGELGLIDDAPRSASAVAHDATEIIGFFKPDLMSLIHRRPDLGLKILLSVATTLSARLRHAHEELERFILNPPTETQIRERVRVTC